MSTDDSPQSVANAYFDAWKANDIARVRPLLHTDVDFVGALGKTHGVAETLSGLGGMFAMTRQVEVIHRWVDGPDVLTWFELQTATAGPMAIVNWSHVDWSHVASPGSGSRSTHARCLLDITVATGGCVATFVLIPGAGGHAAYWNRLIPELEPAATAPSLSTSKKTTHQWTWMDSPQLWKLQWAITRTSSSSPSHSVGSPRRWSASRCR